MPPDLYENSWRKKKKSKAVIGKQRKMTNTDTEMRSVYAWWHIVMWWQCKVPETWLVFCSVVSHHVDIKVISLIPEDKLIIASCLCDPLLRGQWWCNWFVRAFQYMKSKAANSSASRWIKLYKNLRFVVILSSFWIILTQHFVFLVFLWPLVLWFTLVILSCFHVNFCTLRLPMCLCPLCPLLCVCVCLPCAHAPVLVCVIPSMFIS